MQIKPNVLVDQEAEDDGSSADLLAATDDRGMDVNERDEKVADDQNEVHGRADAGNVVAPDDDRQEEEFRYRCQHEAAEQVQC